MSNRAATVVLALVAGGFVAGCSLGPRGYEPLREQLAYVERHGEPAYVEQQAGDLTRRFSWDRPPKERWRVDVERLIYPDSERVAVFERGVFVREEVFDPNR